MYFEVWADSSPRNQIQVRWMLPYDLEIKIITLSKKLEPSQ